MVLAAAPILASCSSVANRPAPPEQSAAETLGLAGTRWRLIDFQSMDDSQGRTIPAHPDRYTITFGTDGRASMQIDCNRGSAPWRAIPSGSGGGSLTFGAISSTRMACQELSMSRLMERQLPYVRSYTLSNGRLHMSLMADGGVFTWEPAPNGQ
jgi:heat shock protein HslJ